MNTMQMISQTLTSRVADALIERIQQGAYPVGAKLPAGRLLAQEFAVSAAVIREATERLRTKGLIESRQGAGCRVLARTVDEGFLMAVPLQVDKSLLQHIYELRLEIEAGAAALAAKHASAKDIAEMERILTALEKALNEPEQALEWDLAFHQAVAAATGNPHYRQLLKYLAEQWRHSVQVARQHTLSVEQAAEQSPRHSLSAKPRPGSKAQLSARVHEEHVAVLLAIKQKNAAQARRAARKHLKNAGRRLGLDLSSL